jgi:hypothetical protein
LYSSHEQESHVDLSFLIVWAPGQMDPTRGWLISRTTTLTCHLRDCELQPAAIRANAAVECSIAMPSRARPQVATPQPSVPSGWPATAYASRPVLGNFSFASILSPDISPLQHSPTASMSRAPSPAPSDVTNWSHPSKRACISRSRPSSFVEMEPPSQLVVWSQGEQALFETSLARLTASAGFPL